MKRIASTALAVLASAIIFSAFGVHSAFAFVPLTGATAIEAGDGHNCAVTSVGGVVCWGRNDFGQLGDGSTTDRLTAVNVSGLASGVTAIAAGIEHSCALTNIGGVKCWGLNSGGELGDGTNVQRLTPVDVIGLPTGVIAITANYVDTCVLTSAGGVKCWGGNLEGELGDGTTAQRFTPGDVSGLTNGVIAITMGVGHACALTSGGGVKCWGFNGSGQLGDGTLTQRLMPVDVSGLTSGVTAISAGYYYTCALTSAGGVKCWGDNFYGQIGDGTSYPSHYYQPTPVDVIGLTSGVSAISAGFGHTCALTSVGGMKCWGYGGALGDGTTTQRLTPVDVSGLTSGVLSIAAGGQYPHTCALTTGGAAKCWGSNTRGSVGDNSTTDRLTPVDVLIEANAPPPLPTLSINNVSLPEGNAGVTPFTFTVTLSAPSASTVTVNYATADDTATAGSDYTATSGVLTFNPGVTTQTITVNVNGDTAVEPDETFFVNLSSPTNATIAVAQGTGTILNDDAAPPLAPQITMVSPSTGPAGTVVTIYGSNFGASQGTSIVRFGVTQATVNSWSDTQIIAVAPTGLSGAVSITVTTAAGTSGGVSFTYTAVIPPNFTLSQTSLNFGDTTVGATSPAQVVVLINTGGPGLVITSTALLGPNKSDFTISANTCVGPISQAGCSFKVTFTPSIVGTELAHVAIASNAITLANNVTLQGAGVPLTQIEKKCAKSNFTDWSFAPWYGSTCDLIAILRRPEAFQISSADVSDDVLYNWLRTDANEAQMWALVGNLKLGSTVDNFIQTASWDGDAADAYLTAVKKAGGTIAKYGNIISKFLVVLDKDNSVALAFSNVFFGTLNTIYTFFKTLDAAEAYLTNGDARTILDMYVFARCGGASDPCNADQVASLVTAQNDIKDLGILDLAICVRHAFACPNGHASDDQVNTYFNWLEIQYQAYRLTHYPVSSPIARQQIGKAISSIATGP